MNAKEFSSVRTLVDVKSGFQDLILPPGTVGTIVECYENPEGYAVDLAIPDITSDPHPFLVILFTEQFEFVDSNL